MLDWVTKIYHAIALANGGKYLVDLQRVRAELMHSSYLREHREQDRLRYFLINNILIY